MNPLDELRLAMSRRHFFNRCGVSLGTAALASMLSEDALAEWLRTEPGVFHSGAGATLGR